MNEEKTMGELLADKLLSKKKTVFDGFADKNEKETYAFCDDYIACINAARTEREFTTKSVEELEAKGFTAFDPKKAYKAGDRIYLNNRGKSLVAAVLGAEPLEEGVRLAAAHIDSPRLDLKPNPLYEDNGLGFFKTHYYGGIKKYQWTTIPLAIHGVVALQDGTTVKVTIGEDESDPVLCVTDILPHLSHRIQDDRKTNEVIKGEELNVLLGSKPLGGDKVKEPVKLALMQLLNQKYGIVEEDFVSAELEVIPALKARYLGLDRSMIGAYGHDDRVCAYTALRAFCADLKPRLTTMLVLADKEEIGSEGNTGLNSDLIRNFVALLSRRAGCDPEIVLRNTKVLSADVNAAFDPTFPDVNESRNCAYLGAGPVLTKYTGARGKYDTNDAPAEFVGEVRALLNRNEVPWQTGELGKVDEGGGGTVAKYISHLGAQVVDIGVALLSMHAPYEVASVYDVYAT